MLNLLILYIAQVFNKCLRHIRVGCIGQQCCNIIFCCDKTVKDVWRIDVPINRLKGHWLRIFFQILELPTIGFHLVLSACGGGKIERVDQIKVIGFSKITSPKVKF